MIEFSWIEFQMVKLIFLALFILIGCSIIYELSGSFILAACCWLAFPLIALFFGLLPAVLVVGIYSVLGMGFICKYISWQIQINEIKQDQVIRKYDYRSSGKR